MSSPQNQKRNSDRAWQVRILPSSRYREIGPGRSDAESIPAQILCAFDSFTAVFRFGPSGKIAAVLLIGAVCTPAEDSVLQGAIGFRRMFALSDSQHFLKSALYLTHHRSFSGFRHNLTLLPSALVKAKHATLVSLKRYPTLE